MTDSKLYSSLFALVDSHLSKTSVQENESEEAGKSRFQLPTLNGLRNGTTSETQLPPCQRLPIPMLSVNESPITNVLAEQVANMLKAKERKQQEQEKQKLEEEMRRLKIEDEKNTVIDLMKAIQIPYKQEALSQEKSLSSSSSFESLFQLNFTDYDGEPEQTKSPEPLLPCLTDMSYILNVKVKKGKGSSFGKVLTSRLRPVAAPYLKEKIITDIVQFDFSSPSPCDLIKEKLRKPTMSCSYTVSIT